MDNVNINVSVSAGNGSWKDDEKVEVALKSEHTIDLSLLDNKEIRKLVRDELIAEFSMKLDIVINNAVEKMTRKLDERIGQPKAGE